MVQWRLHAWGEEEEQEGGVAAWETWRKAE